jgi:hypothetical protein
MYIFQQFSEAIYVSLETSHAKDRQSIFGQRAGLIKAAYINFPSDIDSAGGDTIDPELT